MPSKYRTVTILLAMCPITASADEPIFVPVKINGPAHDPARQRFVEHVIGTERERHGNRLGDVDGDGRVENGGLPFLCRKLGNGDRFARQVSMVSCDRQPPESSACYPVCRINKANPLFPPRRDRSACRWGDVIEKILRHGGLWHASSPRAPPTGDLRVHDPEGHCEGDSASQEPRELTFVDEPTFWATF